MIPVELKVADLDKLATQARTVRQVYESEWLLNMAAFEGNMWANVVRGRVTTPQVPAHIHLVTDNRILPMVLTRLARMTKQKPTWTATPTTANDDAIDSAEVAERGLEYRWAEDHLEAKHFTALLWANVCCAGFWKMSWDKTLGDGYNVILGPDGQPIQQTNGRLMRPEDLAQPMQGTTVKRVNQGDVRVDVRTPFQILPDPLGERIDDCEWLIEEVVHSPSYVQKVYGKKLEGDTSAQPGMVETGQYLQRSASQYKGVKVSEFWLRPSVDHPNGKHIVWAKGAVLLDEDNPYKCLPYVMFSGVTVPSRFWPTSITTQIRPLNVDLNKIKSQIWANATRFGNLSLLKPRSADITWSGIPGENLIYNDVMPNSTPSFLVPPPIPQYIVEQQNAIEDAMREISGQHEVTGGQVPAGVTAASAINLLLEQDDTRLGPAIYDDERALSESGQMILDLMAENYTDERVLRFVGPDADVEVITIKGELLQGAHRIQVQTGSTAPVSKAAKQAAMTQILTLLVQNGHAPDDYAMERFLRDYQVGGLEHLFSDQTEDVRQVNREHRRLFQGIPVGLNDFDNDAFHIQAHEDKMKSSAYEKLRITNELAAQAVEQHVQLHRDRQAKSQAALAQAHPTIPAGAAPGLTDQVSPLALAPPQPQAA